MMNSPRLIIFNMQKCDFRTNIHHQDCWKHTVGWWSLRPLENASLWNFYK